MAKINILSSQVYNRIAAGEVVDRPYSVVKELVENAIDAGATEIEIHIEKGGKELIRVIDNGSGIAYDDLHSAFLPHATSKISKAEDLESIMTLGFRGEAVASIASVSKMTIISKTADGDCYALSSDGGKMGEIVRAAGQNGTDVKVEMLFFNTPVRLGFLKSDKAEETDITNFVSRFILNRPNISFTYYANGKKILQSFGGGAEEALVGVYGAAILQNTYEIKAEKHGIRLRGYIGNQNFSKPNKSYQSVFLNGRYIVNATISAAISNAYASYLMKRQYPFYVLYIDVPAEIVDVNVHPNKADVRFADNQMIYGCIYSVIAAVLDGQSRAMEYIVPSKFTQPLQTQETITPKTATRSPITETKTANTPVVMTFEEAVSEVRQSKPQIPTVDELPFEEVSSPKKPNLRPAGDDASILSRLEALPPPQKVIPLDEIDDFTGTLVNRPEKPEPLPYNAKRKPKKVEKLLQQFPDLYFKRNELRVESHEYDGEAENQGRSEQQTDAFSENKRYLEELETSEKQNRIEISSCRFVGKLFNTYLLYERSEDVFIIDQHAAHERLIFDRLKEKMSLREIVQQPMLLPYELRLNAFESAFIRERMDDIRAMGFDLQEGGENLFKIYAVPVDLQSIKLADFFNEILGDISGFKAIKLEELIKDKLAMAACKAAVKGGMDLTQAEIDKLFQMIDGNMGLKCPHGRPVVTKISKTELEKMFKRKV
ncbi:MAG: DNA mismatch repair endonuclease MutL [Clostridia bacterium]|nr:DNA mismatch repair endonuclease MutL [Clostridia bacterium]